MESSEHTPADSVEERRRRERRIRQQGFLISLILHALLFVLLSVGPSGPESPLSAAGPQDRDDQAADGVIQTVQLRSAPPEEVVAVPEIEVADVIVEIEEPDLEPDPDVEIAEPDLPDPGVGDSRGDDAADDGDDAGIPEATGAGDGGQSEEGLTRVIPPSPRGMIIPPTDSELRGRTIEVWVFVGEDGRVVADSTRLEPETPSRSFNRRLIQEANQWIFNPARQAGEAVAAWFPYRVSM
ncbi:MAG: hypothetical protein EA352_01300 [Gemmatimonadales bacterium]|nr:MAG: hypothetical protein EA352_01300 [Gemmatimonadales bacterium]